MKAVTALVTAAVLVLVSASAAAQAFRVHGRVYEPSQDRGVPGLTVKLTSTSSPRVERVTSTGDDGTYRIDGVAAGAYTLTVMQGLRRIYSTGLDVRGDVTKDVPLEIRARENGAPRGRGHIAGFRGGQGATVSRSRAQTPSALGPLTNPRRPPCRTGSRSRSPSSRPPAPSPRAATARARG